MAVQWHLKTYLAHQHGIYRPTDFRDLVLKKTQVLISLPNISKLLNRKPSSIRLKTMELLCTALDCNLSDFCQIKPSTSRLPETVKKLSPMQTPNSKRGVSNFPDPTDYE